MDAYMGHFKWMLIDNKCKNFEAKINIAKDRIHYILGHKAESQFYKKFLLKIQSDVTTSKVPIKLPPK
jgi:hypothetical protein